MIMSALINVTQQSLFTSLCIPTKVCRVFIKRFWKNVVNFAVLYCFLWFVTHVTKSAHFSLSTRYAIFPLSCISKWREDILNDCFQIVRCNQVWGWLTSSITSFLVYQGSQQILMWWMDGSQRIIDPLYEGQ